MPKLPRDPKAPPEKPDLYVVARFLDKLVDAPTGYTRSRLQAAVRVNYDLFRSYLAWLDEQGYIETKPDAAGKDTIHATPAAREAHARLVQWIKDVLGDVFR